MSAFSSLRHYNYRVWTVGSLVSNVGTWVQRTAQDWLVLTGLTHHSAAAVGVVMALQFGPQLLLLPWTGSAADHSDQRKLLIATQAVSGVFALILGLLTLGGAVQLWHVYLCAFASGCAAAFDAPARQTFVSQMVGDDDLHNAVALNAMSFNIANLVGPAVSGILIGVVGIGWAFLINAASFVAVVASLLMLDTKALHPSGRTARTRGSFAQGLRYVAKRGDLVAILVMLSLIGTFCLNFPIFISVMAVRTFHVDAQGYGLLSSIMAIGTVVGAYFNARRRTGYGTLVWSAGLLGIGFTLAAFAPFYWAFGFTLIIIGISYLTFLNTTNSLVQLTTEPAMRGRVSALRIAVALGGTPVGAPIVGWVADHFGPRWALGVGALAGFSAAIVAVYTFRRIGRGEAARAQAAALARTEPDPDWIEEELPA
jgi:MFS family permease